MLEELVKRKGHKIIFLPKCHCELNPIEMVCSRFCQVAILTYIICSIGVGASTDIMRNPRKPSNMPKRQ